MGIEAGSGSGGASIVFVFSPFTPSICGSRDLSAFCERTLSGFLKNLWTLALFLRECVSKSQVEFGDDEMEHVKTIEKNPLRPLDLFCEMG